MLQDHTDEVWHIAFSHGGTMLASASRDNSAIIYSIDPLRRHVSRLHSLQARSAAAKGWTTLLQGAGRACPTFVQLELEG